MNKKLLILGIALILIAVPIVRGENIDDQSPFWTKLFSNIFSVNFYDPSNPADVACAKQWNCIYNPDIQKTRIDCYSSGTSSSGCLCEYTASSTLLAANGCSSTPTSTTSGSCSLGSGGTLSSGSSKCIGSIKMTCTNGVLSSKIDSSCGTTTYTCTTGATQCNGNTLMNCVNGNWVNKDCTALGETCGIFAGITGCIGTATTSNCIKNGGLNVPGGDDCCAGLRSGLDTAYFCIPITQHRDITDEEIKNLNEGGYTQEDGKLRLHDTSCSGKSDCINKVCKPKDSIGLDYKSMYFGASIVSAVCYSGTPAAKCSSDSDCTTKGQICDPTVKTCTTLKPTTCTVDKDCSTDGSKTCVSGTCTDAGAKVSKSLSLTYQDWKDTSIAQRFQTLCKTKDDCAPYDDVSGTGKEYSVACNSASTKGQLQTDVDEFCKSTGNDKYFAVGSSAIAFAGGCGLSAAIASGALATTWVGIPAIPIAAPIACYIGGTAATVTTLATVEGLHNALVINCKEKAVPKDVGACIAVPKGGAGTFAWLTEEHDIFGVSVPTWGIAAGVIVLLMLLPVILGGGRR